MSTIESGQILRGTPCGDAIYNLAMRDDVRMIVEVGSWRGLGSTLCVLSAMNNSGDTKNFTTIESSAAMFAEAMRNWKAGDWMLTGFNPIHGRITELSDLDMSNLTAVESAWLAGDLEAYASCPNVLGKLPERADLLILDGGEFSSHAEFLLLAPRSRFVFLDDTFASRKFRRTRAMILAERDNNVKLGGRPDQWQIVEDRPLDRGGWMVVENVEFS